MKLNEYLRCDFTFYFYNLDDNEIDLVIERPGKRTLLIEIKSSEKLDDQEVRKFIAISKPFGYCRRTIIYRGEDRIVFEQDTCAVPWLTGLQHL